MSSCPGETGDKLSTRPPRPCAQRRIPCDNARSLRTASPICTRVFPPNSGRTGKLSTRSPRYPHPAAVCPQGDHERCQGDTVRVASAYHRRETMAHWFQVRNDGNRRILYRSGASAGLSVDSLPHASGRTRRQQVLGWSPTPATRSPAWNMMCNARRPSSAGGIGYKGWLTMLECAIVRKRGELVRSSQGGS